MRSVNKVIIVGNLTRDPELKQTQGGQAIVTFGVATNREWTTKEGDRSSNAEFHEVVGWGRRAEICHQILKKGNLVYIEGYLKTRSWDGEDGKKRYRTEIVIEDIIKLEKRQPGEEGHDISAVAEEESDLNHNEGGDAAAAFGGEEAPANSAEKTEEPAAEADNSDEESPVL